MATMQSTTHTAAVLLPREPAPDVADIPARTWKERLAKRWGQAHLDLVFLRRGAIMGELRRIPERMQRITQQARLLIELADDFRSGHYRSISWTSIAISTACLVYAVSPADVIPDALPGIGALDDMVVLTLAMRFLEKDLRAYARFKGYDESQYF